MKRHRMALILALLAKYEADTEIHTDSDNQFIVLAYANTYDFWRTYRTAFHNGQIVALSVEKWHKTNPKHNHYVTYHA